MGSLCSKQRPSSPEAPPPPGRRLGSAPAARDAASAPPRAVGGPLRTLAPQPAPSSSAHGDARARAAEAAEARAQAAARGGKLQSQLSAQKKQSRSDALKSSSAYEQRARDADEAARARNWD